jgi:hypothetical protein
MKLVVVLMSVLSLTGGGATPEYFVSVANQALRLRGGVLLGGDTHVRAVTELEQQVKRVMGADPALDLNVTSLRDRPDTELLRILFLAVLGNYTSAAAPDWNQPCRLGVDPQTGLVHLHDESQGVSISLKVAVVLLVAVQMKQKIAESQQQQLALAASTQGEKRHDK